MTNSDFDLSGFDEELISRAPASNTRGSVQDVIRHAGLEAPGAAYREVCAACKGTKVFRSYSGRVVGQCFKCRGQGFKTFKTAPEQREASKAAYQERKAVAATNLASEVSDWAKQFDVEYDWLVRKAPSFDFAANVLQSLHKFGSLKEGQIAAIRRCLARDAAYAEQKAAETSVQKAETTEVNVSKIQQAFDTARANHVPKPKLNLGNFLFKQAPDSGRNPGAIYVTENKEYLGKIVAGKLHPTLSCTPARSAEIAEIAADPYAAALAYGERTRNCAICSRKLTNGVSVDIGIGPICRENYGW